MRLSRQVATSPPHHQTHIRFTDDLRRVIQRGGFFGADRLLIDRGSGWLGLVQLGPGVLLPDHAVFAALSADLLEF